MSMLELMKLPYLTALGFASVFLGVPHAGAATVENGFVSTIQGADAGLCLGVSGSSSYAGAKLQSQSCTGSNFQKWKFVQSSANSFAIVNVGSGQCIDVPGGSSVFGTQMQQWNCGGGDHQKWEVSPQGSGQFSILSKYNHLAMEVLNASKANGAPVAQWAWASGRNQKWTIPAWPSSAGSAGGMPADGSVITLIGKHAGNCLGVTNSSTESGARLRMQACNGLPFQQWKIKSDAAGAYRLANLGSGLCVDIPGGATEQTVLQQWGCGDGSWQKWQFRAAATGQYYITSKVSGLALEEDVRRKPGAVLQSDYTGAANQAWSVSSASAAKNQVPNQAPTLGKANQLPPAGSANQAPSLGKANPLPPTGGANQAPRSGGSSAAKTETRNTDVPLGFGAGTTGGAGPNHEEVTVTNPADLAAALCSKYTGGFCSDETPRIIRISGVLDFRGREGSATKEGCLDTHIIDPKVRLHCKSPGGQQEVILNDHGACNDPKAFPPIKKFKITYDAAGPKPLKVGSNKTVIGVGVGSGLKGKGLEVQKASNVIIRNLSITDVNDGVVWGGDAITLDDARNVWIADNYTARIGRQHVVTGISEEPVENVTISGNYFDGTDDYAYYCDGRHYYAVLLGAKDQTTTVVGNRFHSTSGRSPQVGQRGGIIHLVNNYYDNNSGAGGLAGSDNLSVLVEGNYFGRGDNYHPISDRTPNKTNERSHENFAPIAGNSAVANNWCGSVLKRNCTANVDMGNAFGSADFLLNPKVMSEIQSINSAAAVIKSTPVVDPLTLPNRSYGPRPNIVP